MASIKINGDTSGSTTISAPATGSDETIELSTALASKPAATYGTAEPSSPATGDIWYDDNSDPALAKFYDGTSWQTFSEGAADFSDSATGTYTDTGVSYKYITFTASGTLTVTKAGFADVLVVGGGGRGTSARGGGGGAGGYLEVTDLYLPSGTLTVSVGAGGTISGPGSPSHLFPLLSTGGGQAGSGEDGFDGGSGGGGAGKLSTPVYVGGSGITGWGNDGGSGDSSGNGGGGGGAGAAGGAPSNPTGGAGGNGTASSITGSSVTRAGGGGGRGVTTGGAGGSGGGGAGGSGDGAATSGTANTGGGGGGSNIGAFGNGGSGVVIVRVRT